MDEQRCCVHAYISGKVQGVWFRAFTRKQALAANVTGWAKNLSDGRVEVMLAGDEEQISRVIDQIRIGPPLARVTDILQQTLPYEEFSDFSTH